MPTYVSLMGGLGNQLFQYAYARYLLASGLPVAGLLTNSFAADRYGRRPHVGRIATLPLVQVTAQSIAEPQLLRDENGERLRGILAQAPDTTVVRVCIWYWQDPRYVTTVQESLLRELHPTANPAGPSPPCMLHVRRRDYGHHGLLPVRYYLDSLERCGWPSFGIVTDEPNFCEHVFGKISGFSGVSRSRDSDDPWEDFHAMAGARVQIIANSSFSWWTAWLGRVSGRSTTIIAPAQWSLQDGQIRLPAEWLRVDCRLTQP